MINNFLIFFLIFSFTLIFFCRKYNILIDQKIEKHKKYSTKSKSFLIGGILIISFLNYYHLFVTYDPVLCLFINFIFLIGILSDLKKINNVSLIFFLKYFLVLFFLNFLSLKITNTRIDFFDQWLTLPQKHFICDLCLLVLKNGSNFIDGINGLTIGYYFIIF